MKNLLFISLIAIATFSGCAQKQQAHQFDSDAYQRANQANKEALDRLDRE